ncbi:hypothetical protein ABVK25_000784 [Lepraria finkii]|uniref:Uncharacterized protein n=1 Tax=Lepraria finkii TaxID=1340010 RepID=A0ABR4BR17_9LECA
MSDYKEPLKAKLPPSLPLASLSINHAKANAELAVYLSYKRTLYGKPRFLEEYKIRDSSFGEGTSVNREMKAFAYAEENLNAEGEKHTKKGKEGRVKREVHEKFVGRLVVVEEREGEILELARRFEDLQAKLKRLRDEADAAKAAKASGALEE